MGDVSYFNSIVFSVKASNDAHVALHTDDGGLWEIVIGGWGNGRSCIHGAPYADERGFVNHNPLNSE